MFNSHNIVYKIMIEKIRVLSNKGFLLNVSLKKKKRKVQLLLKRYNQLMPYESKRRTKLIEKILYKIGKDSSIYPPFYCDYGFNITIGNNSFINVNSVILDVDTVQIGSYVLIGPNVTITTAKHPINSAERRNGYVCGAPINIDDNVWIGAGAIINPGVKIGKNSIIGSGSIVTHNIPSNVCAVGNPCEIIRYL